MSRLVIIPVACGAALGASFASFSVLRLFEDVIELPPINGEWQGAYPGVFGLPWERLATPLVVLSAALGFYLSTRAFSSPSPVWRFHVPFAFGLLLLAAALSVTVSAIRHSGVWSVDSALVWPAPMQAAVITMFSLFVLTFVCHSNP